MHFLKHSVLARLPTNLQLSRVTKAQSACFCTHFRPVLRFGQFFGLVPFNLCHTNSEGSDAVESPACSLVARTFSIPTLLAIIFTLLFIQSTHFTIAIFPALIAPFFEKTDFYAFVFQICMTYSTTTFILFYVRLRLGSFRAIFTELHEMWVELRALNPEFGFSTKFRYRVLLVLGVATVSCLGYTAWFTYSLHLECKPRGFGLLQCFTPGEALQKIAYPLMPYYQQGVAVLLCTMALIANSFHVELSKQLKIVLESAGSKSGDDGGPKILHIRRLHARLCNIGGMIGSYFGIPALALCCTGIVIWIGGFYGLILNSENLLPPSDDPFVIAARAFYVNRYCEMYFGLNVIASLAFGGQILANSGSFCEDVIFDSRLVGLDVGSEYQVLVFIRNLRTSKKAVKAGNICSIGLRFLSSGIVHLFTYLIVLLQFRTSHA